MLKKSLIAAAALASVVTLASVPAKADPQVSIGFGFGFGGPVYGGFDDDFYPRQRRRHHGWDDYQPVYQYSGISCGAGARVVRQYGFRGVQAFDCSAPVYSYQAWKHGEQFEVRVSSRGRIISVDPAY